MGDGGFRIEAHRIVSPGVLQRWDEHGYVTIFKPGYGCYPNHEKVKPMFVPNGTMPVKQYVTFELPKLNSTEERSRNLFEWSFDYEVPYLRQKHLFDLRNEEAITIGEEPWPVPDIKEK